jgi:hypothetical protein
MKTEDVMDSLLGLGMQRGEITNEELYEAFPAEFFPLDEMERFLSCVEHLGIKIVETEDKQRRRRRQKRV